jgi:uncharacterized membrane protein YeaQ/YmgE (transglycosylase-associated protein family)/uncharacterized protein YjbJ (UPF0337 family)
MNSIIWIFAGAALGWLAPIILRRRHADQLLNILVGMVGAFLAGYLFPRVFRIAPVTSGIFSFAALIIALGGAALLLVIFNFFRRENNVKNEVIERDWPQLRDKIHTRWGKLTDEDVAKIDGSHNRFIATLQERYGWSKSESEDQIQRYLKSILVDSGRFLSHEREQTDDRSPDSHS